MIVNPLYLKQESIEQLQKAWREKENFHHLVLTRFFTKEIYKEKEKKLKQLSFKRERKANQYSYAHAKTTSLHILDNKELLQYIGDIIGEKIKNILGEAQYFSWKDYILLPKKREKNGIDLIIDFTEEWKEEWGGAAIYRDGKGKSLKLMTIPNTLSIIERKNTQKYIQYLNNLSKGRKRYIIFASVK